MVLPANLGNTIGFMDLDTDVILTVVIPVTRMALRLENLEKTLVQCRENRVKVVLVHDVQDTQTGPELQNLIRKFSDSDGGFITFIEEYCGSPGLARNLGKNLVSTKWIAFWDSDDIALVSEFLWMIDEANARGDQVAVGGYRVLDSNVKSPISTHEFSGKHANPEIGILLNPGIWRWGFRNELIGGINFQNFKMGEDQVFLLDCSVLDHRIYYCSKLVYDYFVNSNSQSTNIRQSFERLSATTSYIFTTFEEKSAEMKKFSTVVLLRLFLTGLKKCNFTDKINLVAQFFSQYQTPGFYNPRRIGSAIGSITIEYLEKLMK